MADDVHNPFGDDKPAKQKREPGVFDPDRKGENDPFKGPPDDGRWDEFEEPPSTKDA